VSRQTEEENQMTQEDDMPVFATDQEYFDMDVEEWIEVCQYNNRTPEENRDMLIADNPDTEDVEYFNRICNAVKIKLANSTD